MIEYTLPMAIAFLADGLDHFLRARAYRKNIGIIRDFRHELGALDNGKRQYGFVIPAYRNPGELGVSLEDLMGNVGVPRESIIVIDDYSNDEGQTKNVALRHGVELLEVSKEEKDVRKVRAMRKGVKKWLERDMDYVVCFDSDCTLEAKASDLELAMAEMDMLKLDAMAGEVLPIVNGNSLADRIQLLEYKQGMSAGRGSMYKLNRHNQDLPRDISELKQKYSIKHASQLCVSGAFGIFKPEMMKQVLDEMKVYGGGEDSEITLRHLARNAKIGYNENLVVKTLAPSSFKDWFHQRDLWSQFMTSYMTDSKYVRDIFRKDGNNWKPNYNAGGLALRVQMLRDVYLHPVKMASLPFFVTNLPMFATFLGAYEGLSIGCSSYIKKEDEKRDWAAEILLPFYRLGQLVGPMTVGYAKQFGRIFRRTKRKSLNNKVLQDE